MTTNVAYWRDRFTALEKADQQDILKHIKNIDKYYNRAANSLTRDIKYWYSKVAENNNISYAAALKMNCKIMLSPVGADPCVRPYYLILIKTLQRNNNVV